jgi:hypothetical protein
MMSSSLASLLFLRRRTNGFDVVPASAPLDFLRGLDCADSGSIFYHNRQSDTCISLKAEERSTVHFSPVRHGERHLLCLKWWRLSGTECRPSVRIRSLICRFPCTGSGSCFIVGKSDLPHFICAKRLCALDRAILYNSSITAGRTCMCLMDRLNLAVAASFTAQKLFNILIPCDILLL